MRVQLGPELEDFRAEVREWIARFRVPVLETLGEARHERVLYNLAYGAWTGSPGELAEGWDEWVRRNHEHGYLCPHWPVAVGGRGWDTLRMAMWNEELARSGMPRANRGLGEHLVGPAVIVHGTLEQQSYFLPRVIAGKDMYAQGFSEPDAGSDLASLRTVGRVVGDEIVVSGQKIWTSFGHLANKIFVLCRTSPTAPKHRGITYVIMDIAGNGIEMRSTRQITGDLDFTEEHLESARAPLFNVIGGIDNGWRVAMTVLGYERGQMATIQHMAAERKLSHIVAEARRSGRTAAPDVRRRLVRAHARVEALRFAGLRILAGMAFEEDIERVSSAGKVYFSELEQELAMLGFELRGPRAVVRPPGDGYELHHFQHDLLHARCLSIQGGTNEVQRNILGERVLGLPKEPPAVSSR